ncbi:cytochrome ubiquinol oxidase subunit I [Desulfocurvibacter africanus]|uniref:cytochrome ubiquinol oxidase subunit I n=1 Tax=Desulfocurvibacter africanus TaxID=873 RepID=UPI0004130522|nr:cytochrome ubiquinol oxidase subunit I [Desulfocurvibacter africanus]
MEYPVWQVPYVNSGLLIAIIAVVHVFVAHFAVGGGLYLVLAERLGLRRDSRPILDYVRGHTKFFLLLTMVFGALTGVGIWFIISLVNPGATSVLVHSFVFAWAAEWTFFLGEIVALLVYHYTFGRMNPRDHQRVGWLYAAFAWLSLFAINGILGFMLTPGTWSSPADFWAGFFNPTFWPSLALRTCLALILAGLFGLLTATRIADADARQALEAFCSKFVAVPSLALPLTAWWYLEALPEPQMAMVLRQTADIAPFAKTFLFVMPLVFLGGMAFCRLRLPSSVARVLAVFLLVLGFAQIASFEWVREAGRRPWVIHGHMYSSGITVVQANSLQGSFLQAAKWSAHKTVTEDNALEAGRELYVLQCKSCHGLRGPMLDIARRAGPMPVLGLETQLAGQGKLRPYMPPFLGDAAERTALSRYITEVLRAR